MLRTKDKTNIMQDII